MRLVTMSSAHVGLAENLCLFCFIVTNDWKRDNDDYHQLYQNSLNYLSKLFFEIKGNIIVLCPNYMKSPATQIFMYICVGSAYKMLQWILTILQWSIWKQKLLASTSRKRKTAKPQKLQKWYTVMLRKGTK